MPNAQKTVLMAFMLGVDEAGRGPLAGPVAVAVVMVPGGLDGAREFPGVADSKALSERKREAVFTMLEARLASGDLRFVVEYGSEGDIDARGIAVVIRAAVARGVNALVREYKVQPLESGTKVEPCIRVLLDGALRAPPEYAQQTIIGGDASIPLISLASIAAKVSRDRLMVELAPHYPHYGFELHKGYGTALHYVALRKHGLCPIHRESFIHLDRSVADG